MKNQTKDNSQNGHSKMQAISRGSKAQLGIVTVQPGKSIQLAKIDPDACGAPSKEKAKRDADQLQKRLSDLQQVLYAEHKRSLLLAVQAMDTGGKDGVIKKLCSGLDPNGVQLANFKFPTPDEWDHDFLWRIHNAAPRRGSIGIWNRSHYEDVLVPRVHKQISEEAWRARCEDINAFERLLARNGVTLLKFFLHISKDEQKARLQARLSDPHKLWKFNPGDLKERALWPDYQLAYEAVINRTSSEVAPWHVVSANHKWSRNVVVLRAMVAAMEAMNPQYPTPEFDPKTIVIE